jgi:hypothetical protein
MRYRHHRAKLILSEWCSSNGRGTERQHEAKLSKAPKDEMSNSGLPAFALKLTQFGQWTDGKLPFGSATKRI